MGRYCNCKVAIKKVMGENMMPSDPELLEGYQHREAGLAGQLNIESVEGIFDD